MKTLGLVVLLAAAANALPIFNIPAADSVVYKCAVNNEFAITLKSHKAPFHLCSNPNGDHFLLAAAGEDLGSTFETSLAKADIAKLKEVKAIITGPPAAHARARRSPQFGGGFGGAGSSAQANAGSFGGGGGYGGFPGYGGGLGGGGGFSNAQASSGSFGGGGGFGGPFLG